MLKQYGIHKSRIVFLEKQLNILSEEVYDNFYYELKKKEYSEKINEMRKEYSQLKYLKDTLEDSICMASEIDERFKIIIHKYFLNNVRMEDIADHLHISRSRCYELYKKSLTTISKIMFGNAS